MLVIYIYPNTVKLYGVETYFQMKLQRLYCSLVSIKQTWYRYILVTTYIIPSQNTWAKLSCYLNKLRASKVEHELWKEGEI
jgi:hypothetical protein